jgi:hypothetical protein
VDPKTCWTKAGAWEEYYQPEGDLERRVPAPSRIDRALSAAVRGDFVMSDEKGKEDYLLESLPEHVVATMEVRDRFVNALGQGGSLGLEFLVDDVQKWKPGQTVKVAFLDGSDALCREIADVTGAITAACNIKFDFGQDGAIRRWSESDREHAADIRVSFDKKGYFSLVGTDSINVTIGEASERVGGRAYQCSLNLGGFTVSRPVGWKGTVLHEFLHALAFHHEHQNMKGDARTNSVGTTTAATNRRPTPEAHSPRIAATGGLASTPFWRGLPTPGAVPRSTSIFARSRARN